MANDSHVQTRAQKWLNGPFDPETKAEVKRLIDHDPAGLSDAFFKDLSFGTGGMRGVMGVGTNRLNVYTIRMATQGLANYLKKTTEKPSVFIGYDVRHNSRLFAEEAAKVLSGNGIRALVSKEICPTPLVSFACRYFDCSAAIMITASHNPPQYNGYKVYGHDGCQVVAPMDAGIMEEVKRVTDLSQVHLGTKFEEVGYEIDDAYMKELKGLQMLPELGKKPLRIIYTNLHGTGIRSIPKALKSWGYDQIHLVEKQRALDGNFTNAPSPNPEEEKALELGLQQLKKEKGDILIATDPDADRIGLATVDMRFSGNQTACLCLHHICTTLKKQNKFPKNAAFIKTIVTSELFKAIAEDFGGKCFDVLTGFKYIGEKIGEWEQTGEYKYIFGGEESFGYLFGTFVRDKDAISSACLIAEMAAAAKAKNLTLKEELFDLYRTYGVHRESLTNLNFPESESGMNEMKALMQKLRKHPPKSIGGIKVASLEDYQHGLHDLPPSNVLRFWLEDKTKLVIRPSGTEPKVKIYLEVVEPVRGDLEEAIKAADHRLKTLISAFQKEI